ncbi:MAG: glycosyltransferase [Chloroflexota bacterium]
MSTANLCFSIVVNTTDRADPLAILLKALEQQSRSNFEVIVVVGPTKDHTLQVLEPYADRVTILRCPEANLSQSRNMGLLAANGDIVCYIDDDAVPCHNWIAQLERLFADTAVAGTGGMVYMIHPRKPVVQHRIGIASSLGEQYDVQTSWLENIVPEKAGKLWSGRMMGTNMAFRRQDLLDINGFDEFYEWLYDDFDIAMRLTQAGKVVHPVKEAAVYHVPASSRNRVANSFNARWWVQTKSVLYFVIKYGSAVGEKRREIFKRCLHYVHGHLLWEQELRRQGKISWPQLLKMQSQEVRSSFIALYRGLFQPRQLLSQAVVENAKKKMEPIQPFQQDASKQKASVDPISGRRPAITIPDQPLRIGLLSRAYPPNQYEGVGRLTNLMARGLFECGHTVHVVTQGERDLVSFYDGAYVHQVPQANRYGRYRPFTKLYTSLNHCHAVHDKIKRLSLNDGIQIVDSPLWLYDGLITAVEGKIPVVVRLVTALKQIADLQNLTDKDTQLAVNMEEVLLERATHLLPNTHATMRKVEEVYNLTVTPSDYSIVPYGIVPVDDEKIRPFSLQAPPEKFTVLYLGRLEKRKGIRDLFQAIPTVLKTVPNAEFIIAGADNSTRDGFLEQHGMDYATYFQKTYPTLAKHVSFLGQVSEEKLHQLYQSCDLFVAPSLYESFGLIYIEAMNYAKPVIGCRAGGIPEVIDEGITGKIVDPNAPAQLAEAMIAFLTNPQQLYEMGTAGRQQLMERFTYVQMAKQYAAVYQQVIEAEQRRLAS